MNILTWNVRGLGDTNKRAGVRFFLVLNKISVVCLQETKSCTVSKQTLRSIGGSGIQHWKY